MTDQEAQTMRPSTLALILTGTSTQALVASGVPEDEIPEQLRPAWRRLVERVLETSQAEAEFRAELAALVDELRQQRNADA